MDDKLKRFKDVLPVLIIDNRFQTPTGILSKQIRLPKSKSSFLFFRGALGALGLGTSGSGASVGSAAPSTLPSS